MADFEYVFTNLTRPTDATLSLEGASPAGLAGTFYLAGTTGTPEGMSPLHVFDAHGRITAFRVEADGGALKARMVETPLWRQEQAARKVVKRRPFTNKPARWANLFDMDFGNTAGHNVVPWGDAIVVANDPGFFVLDADTLETRGPAPFAPRKGGQLSPMPRVDPRTGRRVFFEHRPGMKDSVVVHELDDRFASSCEKTYRLPRGGAFFHDVGFTDRFYLVMQAGTVSLAPALWGARPLIEALRFDPAQTPMVHLLPRDGGAPISMALPGGRLHAHFWNCFEEDGKVVFDAIGYDGRVSFSSYYPPATRAALRIKVEPTPKNASFRYTADPKAGTVHAEPLTALPAEAPEIRGDRRGTAYRYGYAPTRGAPGDEEDAYAFTSYHALARHDFQTRQTVVWDAGPRSFVSPAAFVARPGSTEEDDGWVLAVVQDAASKTSSLCVFTASDVGSGPIARLRAPAEVGLVGAVTHVCFVARHGCDG